MPNLPHRPSPQQLLEAYNDGFEGWLWNKEIEEKWENFCGASPGLYEINPDIKDLHKKVGRALLFRSREKFDPGAYGQEAQTTGDCVSMGDRNARDTSRAVEADRGQSERYYKRGATEPTYGARGHRGQGMDPTMAAEFVTEYGWLFREVYDDIHVDLSKYNASIGANWGGSGVPDRVKEKCKDHNVGQWTRPGKLEEALDCIAAGYAGHSGQRWGTSSRQPKDGINRKSAGWNHDMGTVGYDLTEEFFKEQVLFVPNSWAEWNEPNPVWLANQDVYGPWIPGMIVVPIHEYEDYFVNSGSIHFYSDIKGFEVKELPSIVSGVL